MGCETFFLGRIGGNILVGGVLFLIRIFDANSDKDKDRLNTLGEYPSTFYSPLAYLLFLIMVSALTAGILLLLFNIINQTRKKKALKKHFSNSTTPIELDPLMEKHKMTIIEIKNLTLEIEGEISNGYFYPAPFLMTKYQAPDYFSARQVKGGNFPDYPTYVHAFDIGARTMNQLELIRQFQAPDFATAKLIKAGNFPDYKLYKKAQRLGLENAYQLELVEKYQVETYQSAVNRYKEEILQGSLSTLKKDGMLVLKEFLSEYQNYQLFIPLQAIASDVRKIIEKEGIEEIHSEDGEVFLTYRYVRERLVEATRVYADLEFETVATTLEIPVEYVPDILVAAIQQNLILGMVDRTNKRFFVREIPRSLFEQMIAGQMVSLNQRN